jgi:hypothetical protein
MFIRGSNMTSVLKGVLAALFLTLLFSPSEAHAQYGAYPCPYGGPSPGHRVVGQTPAGNGVGSVLLCTSDGTEQSVRQTEGPAPAYSRSSRYAAVAMHVDANDVWAITDILNEQEGHEIILARCAAVMGPGCQVTMSVRNGSIAVGRDQRGILWNDWGETPKKAEKKMIANCAVEGGRCKKVHSFQATPGFVFEGVPPVDLSKSYSPNPAAIRNIYGATAWIDGKYEGAEATMIWVSTGKTTLVSAENDAVEQCQKATKAKCSNGARSVNGFFGIAYDSEGGTRVSTDLSKKEAEAAVRRNCKKDKKKCSNIQTVDARQPGSIVINARPDGLLK